jgi:hypothetical protein
MLRLVPPASLGARIPASAQIRPQAIQTQYKPNTALRPLERRSGKRYLPPEEAIDLEADNVLLRAALARSEGAGVLRDLITQELKLRIGNPLAVVSRGCAPHLQGCRHSKRR